VTEPSDRFEREQAFFDASSAAQFEAEPPPPNHHMVMLFDLLGDVAGQRILDCGCGGGELALELTPTAAQVAAFDLSVESVRLMHTRAAMLDRPRPDGFASVMEHLPFDDATFDAVIGKSILHHVDVAAALAETKRVLKPGGRGIFIENQVTNPLLRFARNKLTGRYGVARLGTLDEHPLIDDDYTAIDRLFDGRMRLHYPDFRFFGLFSRNVLRYERALWLARALGRADDAIYRRVPSMRRHGYHVIIEVTKAT
jgi:SAM-dependent methyltransferase